MLGFHDQEDRCCWTGQAGSVCGRRARQPRVEVTGFDLDTAKVEALAKGRAPVEEPRLQETITKGRRRLQATTNLGRLVADSQACFFITPTPSLPDGSFDNQHLLQAVEAVANHRSEEH